MKYKPEELIEFFENTQEMIRVSGKLARLTEESCKKNKTYDCGFQATERIVKSVELNLSVVNGSSFDTARGFTEGKIAVLNFANPYEPGGGVKRGASAQEECLCRCSNLYNVLTTEELNHFYYQWHKQNKNYLFSDRIIYSPNIQIIKSDDYAPLETPFSVEVITCAAPYNAYGFDLDVLLPTYLSRITNILEVAMDNDVDTIVLGAFGCGAFQNPPRHIALAFKEVLVSRGYYKFFKNVVFAIIDQHCFTKNFLIFQSLLLDS